MTKDVLLSTARNYIAKGRLNKAFEVVSTFLASDPKYKGLAQHLLQVKSSYSKLESDRARGILPFEKEQLLYNKTTHDLTYILSQIENDDFGSSEEATPVKHNFTPMLVAIGVLFGAFFVFQTIKKRSNHRPNPPVIEQPAGNNNNTTVAPTQPTSKCPSFNKDKQFNILLLPFENYGGSVTSPHKAIRRRLSVFGERYDLGTDVGIYDIDTKKEQNAYPDNGEDATRLAGKCGANLVIWGSYEQQSPEKKLISASYQSANIDKYFKLDQLQMGSTSSSQQETISSISSIESEGVITGDIENTISLLLAGVAAHEMGEEEKAIALLEEVKTTDKNASLLQAQILADSYIKTGKMQKALTTYDKILKISPNDKISRINRAVINSQNGDYNAAKKDLDIQAKQTPNDIDMLTAKTALNLRFNRLNLSKQNLDAIKQADTNDSPRVRQLNSQYKKQLNIEKQRLKKAKDKLRTNPQNQQALIDAAEANYNLGFYNETLKFSKQIVRLNPDNKNAIIALIKAKKTLDLNPKKEVLLLKKLENNPALFKTLDISTTTLDFNVNQ